MSKLRFDVVQDAFKKRALDVTARPSAYFGELVFNREKMRKYLDVKTYEALVDCIDNGRSLDLATADKVAEGMKEWALEHGVTHITHWFQPLTEVTAEKHDSLMEYDRKGGMIESFNGKSLIQQEPDASSFPSGGIRATFEARGYTAWDPTSPVFIQDDTLCIPTVFISYTGEALDYKTPLKKALKAVSDAAVPICKLFDPKVSKVHSYLGWEQEYFLVDEDLYAARPDLILTGRTLMGHASSKNQQLEDHYFAAIPTRVAAFMKDLEYEGYKLGIPLKTRHNEVAPNQFELAPIFGECNLSNDQNQMIMNVMNKVARKHGFVVLLHEKPFDGINGSGKHNNWSLGTDTGTLLLAPGKDPAGNLQFVTFFVNILAAVQKHNALLKASIASATNAHRLGANEAPPAIVSAFLGRTMTEVLHKLLELPSGTPIEIAGKKETSVGIVEIPEIFVDNTDRNRTSPFAFTGNRFEFRAVGSSANCAGAMTALSGAVAEQLLVFKKALDKELASGKALEVAVMDTLKPIISSIIDVVCFDGNGYTYEWKEEAARRGLDTEMGDVHQEGADRVPCDGQDGHQPRHPRRDCVPEHPAQEPDHDERELPRFLSGKGSRNHHPHRKDLPQDRTAPEGRGKDDRSQEECQHHRERIREGKGLSRDSRKPVRNPQAHRQAGRNRGQRHVAAAQVPRTPIHQLSLWKEPYTIRHTSTMPAEWE